MLNTMGSSVDDALISYKQFSESIVNGDFFVTSRPRGNQTIQCMKESIVCIL